VNSFSNGGRIIIYFPIYAPSKNLFAADLGLGSSAPGCWFGSAFSKEASASSIRCILTPAGTGSGSLLEYYYAKIEVIGFAALIASTLYEMTIGKITNPGLSSSPLNILIMTFNIDLTNNSISYKNSILKALFINELADASILETSIMNTSFGTGIVQ
jgi:hypothetical protein